MGDIFRDTFLGFVRVHVLYHAAKAPIYGVEMIEELAEHGYKLGPGTLYPILHGLEKAGYLASQQDVVDGKVRKYYRATAAGRKVLKELQAKIRELTEEVLDEVTPAGAKAAGRRRAR